VRNLARVVAWVRELLSEDPFPTCVLQTPVALTAFAARRTASARGLGRILRAVAKPDWGGSLTSSVSARIDSELANCIVFLH